MSENKNITKTLEGLLNRMDMQIQEYESYGNTGASFEWKIARKQVKEWSDSLVAELQKRKESSTEDYNIEDAKGWGKDKEQLGFLSGRYRGYLEVLELLDPQGYDANVEGKKE